MVLAISDGAVILKPFKAGVSGRPGRQYRPVRGGKGSNQIISSLFIPHINNDLGRLQLIVKRYIKDENKVEIENKSQRAFT